MVVESKAGDGIGNGKNKPRSSFSFYVTAGGIPLLVSFFAIAVVTHTDETRFFIEEFFTNQAAAKKAVSVEDDPFGAEYYTSDGIDVSRNIVQYVCPADREEADHMKKLPLDYYEVDTRKHRDDDEGKIKKVTFDYTNFMDQTYAGWGITPRQRQQLNKDGWIHWYGDNLQSGDTIYESACGAGLTMYGILDLLRMPPYKITNLEVHGNDYLHEVVNTANQLYNREHKREQRVKKGQFCQGDSTNLSHIPSSSFDLAYTGYIQPMQDPIDIGLELGFLYCLVPFLDYKNLVQKEYQVQEDWIASWITEMVRIAKPGGTIIIEGMASVRCDNKFDWGGVKRSWWKKVASEARYGWDVDPESIEIAEFYNSDAQSKNQPFMQMTNMYNVKMKKKGTETKQK